MAWFQLKTGFPYRSAFDRFSYDDLRGMHHPLHEADESKFIETLLRKRTRSMRIAQPDCARDTTEMRSGNIATLCIRDTP